MLHLNAVASPAVFMMLMGCVLGVGFMLRFFAALTFEERKTHTSFLTRAPLAPHRETVANSAAHLAIGVVRITSALASNAVGRNKLAPVDRFQVLTISKSDYTGERRYRSG
jgi:hypothetical protein